MEWISHAAEWFIGLFRAGADVFVSWMSGIVPLVLVLLIAMNSLIALIGEERINRFAAKAGSNVVSRYLILPFFASFFLCNPMAFTLGRFLPERYKPGYYASVAQMVHTNNGMFPHINPAELFIWAGIAAGVSQLGLSTSELAVRYLLVGAILNFLGGWVTDLTTAYVSKQQGVVLSKEVRAGSHV
ncbi:PTS glucitol/sorbitol transporter subunit IIC [Tessaracoccus sp. OH4464_COT-324]|nr:PTS glucitol/sorbitol transporter subunit IIC [Tessaracoccus sp. OH4464_COT-324]RRD45735.1 PTS glucitol/sorbitol transporter subunit IIC [Tessaracoccus sp. OH4464_COT-324]